MYGIIFCLIFSALFSGAAVLAELNVPEVTESDATSESIQKKAFGLIDQISFGAKSGNMQQVNNAFDDGLTYFLAERNAIMSNLPSLIQPVGSKIKSASSQLSWPQWNRLTDTFHKWTGTTGQGGLVSSLGPAVNRVWQSFGGWQTDPTGGAMAPLTGSTEVEVPGHSPTESRGVLGLASVAGGSSTSPGETTFDSRSGRNVSPVLGAVSLGGLEDIVDLSKGMGDGRSVERNRNVIFEAQEGSSEIETMDLQVVKCFRLPERNRVACLPSLAQLCFNSKDQALPCP